jgi:hypothetical protein
MEHWLTIKLKDYPRSMTKKEYKAISRWLREVRNIVEPEAEKEVDKAIKQWTSFGQVT